MTTYGYIGLGQMGAAMASRLIATGAAVTVFDLDPSAIDSLVDQGAIAAASTAEIARNCDIISICVPAHAHIEALLTDANGLRTGGRSDQTILIHSTVSPETISWACATAREWGVELFDACVAGGADAAKAGEVVVLAGGVSAMNEATVALLDIYGTLVINGGSVGAGAALKVGVNLMNYAQFAAASTAYEIVRANGGDPEALFAAWRHVGQLGKMTEGFIQLFGLPASMINSDLRDSLDRASTLAAKDVQLAEDLISAKDARSQLITALRIAMPTVFDISDDQRGGNDV